MPEEYVHFILMRDVWHCSPEEFARQSDYYVNLHTGILSAERKKEWLDSKRENQKKK